MSRYHIIKLTARTPMTVEELATAMGIQGSSVRTSIRRARAHGNTYLRIAGYRGHAPLYAPGPDPDVGVPGDSRSRARVLVELDRSPGSTVRQVSEALGLPLSMLDAVFRRMHRDGLIHISGYELFHGKTGGGRPAAAYTAGPGRDAAYPSAEKLARLAAARRAEVLRAARKRNAMASGPANGLSTVLLGLQVMCEEQDKPKKRKYVRKTDL